MVHAGRQSVVIDGGVEELNLILDTVQGVMAWPENLSNIFGTFTERPF